jgi:hypothetical protein
VEWSGVEWRGEERRGEVGFTYSTIMIVRTGISEREVTRSRMDSVDTLSTYLCTAQTIPEISLVEVKRQTFIFLVLNKLPLL